MNGIFRSRNLRCLQVDMPKRIGLGSFHINGRHGVDFKNPSWRPQMISDTVSPMKSLGRDDFLVVDPLLEISWNRAVSDVSLRR